MKRIVIWGTGRITNSIMNTNIQEMYSVEAFCDSDRLKWGTVYFEKKILSPKELFIYLVEERDVAILIAVKSQEYEKEIIKKIKQGCKKNVSIITFSSFKEEQEKHYRRMIEEREEDKWEISFKTQLKEWVNNLDSEIDFWLNSVAKCGYKPYHSDYIKRQNNTAFSALDSTVVNLEENLADGDCVLDIGSGLYSQYGKQVEKGIINLIPIDPLAHFYNLINVKYAVVEPKKIEFGLFEFMNNTYLKGMADCIIVNNALDHCIDPYRSIVECLSILKVNGVLHLNHRRSEALFENWMGLHKWNIDYKKTDLILWNQENYLNVTRNLKGVADFYLRHSDENVKREDEFVTVDIVKTKDFSLSDYIDISKDEEYLYCLIDALLKKHAEAKLFNI